MRAVVQRVDHAQVTVEGRVEGEISKGLLVLLALGCDDRASDLAWMKRKILNLRVFDDSAGRMNRSLPQVGGELLVVSQFTLYGDCRKGNRPSYSRSAPPELAGRLYRSFIDEMVAEGVVVRSGSFQASMKVSLTNDGPVTLILDSRQKV